MKKKIKSTEASPVVAAVTETLPERIVKILNEALDADREAVSRLLFYEQTCSAQFKALPNVQIRTRRFANRIEYSITPLSILNALLSLSGITINAVIREFPLIEKFEVVRI